MPIKPKRISFTPHAPDDNGICEAQQIAQAGALTLDGADVSGGVASFAAAGDYERVGYQIGIYSAGNLAGVNFTVTGTDANGDALSETIAGPNNGTAETAGYFRTVTGVSADATVGTDVIVGTVDEFATATLPVDLYCSQTTIAVNIGGTIDFTVQEAFERPTAGETPNWINITALATKTADTASTVTDSIGAVRLIGNSFTGGATVAMSINQPRYV